MQMVYLSNRPNVWRETWQHVRHFMPWVERAVVIAPPSQGAHFAELPGVTVIDEIELTGRSARDLAALDHVRRNVTLRRAAIPTDLVDDEFLLSDDDYRPIKPVDRSFFGTDETDIGYTCHDLAAWPGHSTPFDEAQHTTGQVLSYLGAPRRAYGSHMPQIMRKDLWVEAFDVWADLRDDDMVCEWAWYFNVSQHLRPERFTEPQVFQTMCWPPHPHEWQLRERPRAYTFENFYPDLYAPGAVFDGMPSALDTTRVAKLNVEKLLRWSALGRAAGRLDFSDTPDEPWTKGAPGRRATFRVLHALRKGYDYVSIEEREAISELLGAVERLERRLDDPKS